MDDGLVEHVIVGKEVLVDERTTACMCATWQQRPLCWSRVPAKLDIYVYVVILCICLRLLRLLRYFQCPVDS
jgi:hypothetical protein